MMIGNGRNVMLFFAALFVMTWVLGGCASMVATPAEPRPLLASGPSHAPRIEDGFAVSSLWGGETWRIFVRGSDPDGDMLHLWVVTTQLGRKSDTEIIPLRGPAQGEFSGFLTLRTPNWIKSWDNVRVEVRIRDQAGNLSEKTVFEALIGFPTRESLPSQWSAAAHNHLGTIFFQFEGDGGESKPFGFLRGF
jgi:hypothetical protein